MKKALIISTSTLYGGDYMAYMAPTLVKFLGQIKQLLFVPYARPGGLSHEAYTQKVATFFSTLNVSVKGLDEFENPITAVQQAQAIFVGGGNTFMLVNQLHKLGLMSEIKQAVNNGCLYIGSSAGSNICGLTMQTTNDMPIVYPPSFLTLGLVPFNLNPHYLDPDPHSKHMGETRETRILEFHHINNQPVVGLREGSWLEVQGEEVYLRGDLTARIFLKDQSPFELNPHQKLEF